MKITDQNVASAREILLTEDVRMAFWHILQEYSDPRFRDRVDLLLYQERPGYLESIKEFTLEQYAELMISKPAKGRIMLMAEHMLRTLYAILDPLQKSLGSALPIAKGEALEKLMDSVPPQDYDPFLERFKKYNTDWYYMVATFFKTIPHEACQAVVWAISKTFLDSLPEPF